MKIDLGRKDMSVADIHLPQHCKEEKLFSSRPSLPVLPTMYNPQDLFCVPLQQDNAGD